MIESHLPNGVAVADSVAEFIERGGIISEVPLSYPVNHELRKGSFTFDFFTNNFSDWEARRDPVAAAKKLRDIFPSEKEKRAMELRRTGGVPHADEADEIEAMSLEDLITYSKHFFTDFMKSINLTPFDSPTSISAAKSADKWLRFYTVAAIAVKLPG